MAKLPDFCPHCHAFVGLGSTEFCAMCGQKMVDAQGPNAPFATGAQPAPSQKRRVPFVAIAVGGVMFLCLCVAGALTLTSENKGTDNTGSTVAPGTSATTSTTVDTAAASRHVQSLFLASGDFNPKWKQMDPMEFSPENHLADRCWPNDAQMYSISIAAADYSYNLQSSGAEGAHLFYTVHLAKSTDLQTEQMSRYASASQSCAKDSANAFFTQGGAQVKKESLATVTRSLPVTYADFRWSATTKTGSTTSHPTSEFIVLQGGAAHTLLEFDDCGCKLGPPPDQDAIINHAVSLLQAHANDQP